VEVLVGTASGAFEEPFFVSGVVFETCSEQFGFGGLVVAE